VSVAANSGTSKDLQVFALAGNYCDSTTKIVEPLGDSCSSRGKRLKIDTKQKSWVHLVVVS